MDIGSKLPRQDEAGSSPLPFFVVQPEFKIWLNLRPFAWRLGAGEIMFGFMEGATSSLN